MKKKTWEIVTENFNKRFKTLKTVQQLRDKWDNHKKKAKKASCEQRKDGFRRTGGGPPIVPDVSHIEEKVLGLIGEQIKPIENIFDSDRLADGAVPPTTEMENFSSPPKKKGPVSSNLQSPPLKKDFTQKDELLEMRRAEDKLIMEEKGLKIELLKLKIREFNEKSKFNEMLRQDKTFDWI